MIIKKAQYRKVRKVIEQQVSGDIYGCDCCKKEISPDWKLDITVFFNNKTLKKQDNGSDTDKYSFCSWVCLSKIIQKIECDYFISLPFLHYDTKLKGTSAKDLFKLIK